MLYTFWHAGLLIGTPALDHPARNPGQRIGAYAPTDHGRTIFPRLTGVLTAGLALQRDLRAAGIDPDAATPDELEAAIRSSPAGRRILDIGRALSEVEVCAPDGRSLAFSSIAFSDVAELRRLARDRERGGGAPGRVPPGAARYIVSATFRDLDAPAPRRAPPLGAWSTPWPATWPPT